MLGTPKAYLRIVILATLTSLCFAQDPADSPSVLRSVIVNVFDAHAIAIRDLTKDNFRIRLNGKPVPVLDARYTTAPQRIVVLLDVSGSMTDDNAKWNIAREAVSDLLAQTPKAVPIAMLTFTDDIRDVFDFSQSREAIAEWLDGPGRRPILKHRAKTALFDAILAGLKQFGAVQVGDSLNAITDGGDNASTNSEKQTQAALLQSPVRLYSFLFAQPFGSPSGFCVSRGCRGERESFVSMVVDSGGRSLGFTPAINRGPGTLAYVYDDAIREKVRIWTQLFNLQISDFWTLDLAAPPSDKKRDIKLDVVNTEGKVRKDVTLTYPRLLPPSR